MLIHNKRLHPRRPCEPNEHYHGCMLHEMEEQRANSSRNSIASPSTPNRSATPSSRYSSLSSLAHQRRPRTTSTSSTATSISATPNKRNSIGAYPHPSDLFSAYYDTVDSAATTRLYSKNASGGDRTAKAAANKAKAKSTICLNSSLITPSAMSKSDKRHSNTVTFKCYDSPDEIIANLFPGIGDTETPYLRKGHGAAQMAKNRTTHKDWTNVGQRSKSAMGNYAASNDGRKLRSYSTSSDNSISGKERSHTIGGTSRLYSVERDFNHLRLAATIFCAEKNQMYTNKSIFVMYECVLSGTVFVCMCVFCLRTHYLWFHSLDGLVCSRLSCMNGKRLWKLETVVVAKQITKKLDASNFEILIFTRFEFSAGCRLCNQLILFFFFFFFFITE